MHHFILVFAALAAFSANAFAQDGADPLGEIVQGLPELPGPAKSGFFGVNPNGAEMVYRTRFEKLSAKVDQFQTFNPNLNIDYGLLLTDKLSAGGKFTRYDTVSEVMVNGVFAPQKNVRLRVSGSQLRHAEGFPLVPSADGNAVLQNSYQVNANKYWNKYQYLSDLGVGAYTTEASSSTPETGATVNAPGLLPYGRKDGYLVNLGLRPASQSRIELRHEYSQLSYGAGAAHQSSQSASNRVKLAHYLGNCIRLQGAYTANPDSGRLDLNISRYNWSINLSREQNATTGNTAIRFGYALPLGKRPSRNPNCPNGRENAPSFEPIMDASLNRHPYLPPDPPPIFLP